MYLSIKYCLYGFYTQFTLNDIHVHIPVRLMRGNYRNNGIVEVYVNGQWGTICSSGFGQKEAGLCI